MPGGTLSVVKVAIGASMAPRRKRAEGPPPEEASPPNKRQQFNVLSKDVQSIATNYNNIRDMLGKTDEDMTKQPKDVGDGILAAVRNLAAAVSVQEFDVDDFAIPSASKLRGWVECCEFIESAARQQPGVVAIFLANQMIAGEAGRPISNRSYSIVAEPLARWACRMLTVDLDDGDNAMDALEGFATRGPDAALGAQPSKGDHSFADGAIDGGPSMLSMSPENEETAHEEIVEETAHEEIVEAAVQAGASEAGASEAGPSGAASHMLVVHEEVEKAGEFSLTTEGEGRWMECAFENVAPCLKTFFFAETTSNPKAVLRCVALCCAVLFCAVLCCAVLCCAVPCCAMPCHAVLCSALLCCAVLCCAVLC